jgi:hypothetical protein
MTLGVSLETFTLVHMVISLIGILSGFVVVFGLLGGKLFDARTALFFTTTVLTSVTGFMFPFEKVTPGIKVGIISLVVLAIAIADATLFTWRSIYAVGAIGRAAGGACGIPRIGHFCDH